MAVPVCEAVSEIVGDGLGVMLAVFVNDAVTDAVLLNEGVGDKIFTVGEMELGCVACSNEIVDGSMLSGLSKTKDIPVSSQPD